MSEGIQDQNVTIAAQDGYPLAGTLFRGQSDGPVRLVIVSSATATPRRFYRHFARALAAAGYAVVTYDYRGIGDSRPEKLRGFSASMRDWALLDMNGVIDWARAELAADKVFLVGHSVGGQVAGMLDAPERVDGMVTFSSQSGHWRLQGAEQKAVVAFHVYLTLPVLSRLFGYMPWSSVGAGEDLPKDAAIEWAGWCRDPKYLLGDESLPLDRYARFEAPVLAYSFGDDKWGTARAVDAMMGAYPNLERRHVEPSDAGVGSIGHFGFFKSKASTLWPEVVDWLDAH